MNPVAWSSATSLSLRRHDPDQVQRVTAVLGGFAHLAVSQLLLGAPLGTALMYASDGLCQRVWRERIYRGACARALRTRWASFRCGTLPNIGCGLPFGSSQGAPILASPMLATCTASCRCRFAAW